MKIWAIAAFVAVTGVAAVGKAETVSLLENFPSNFVGLTSGLSVTTDLGGGHVITVTNVGAYNWTVQSPGSPTFPFPQDLYTFCIQNFQMFEFGSIVPYDVNRLVTGSPSGADDEGYIDGKAALQIQGLFDRHWNDAFLSNNNAAAFQLAIWEIEYDAGGFGDGRPASPEVLGSVSASDYFDHGVLTAVAGDGNGIAARNLAATWLGELTDPNLPSSVRSLIALNNSTDPIHFQDQITRAIPLPAALPAGTLLLGGMAVGRAARRRFASRGR